MGPSLTRCSSLLLDPYRPSVPHHRGGPAWARQLRLAAPTAAHTARRWHQRPMNCKHLTPSALCSRRSHAAQASEAVIWGRGTYMCTCMVSERQPCHQPYLGPAQRWQQGIGVEERCSWACVHGVCSSVGIITGLRLCYGDKQRVAVILGEAFGVAWRGICLHVPIGAAGLVEISPGVGRKYCEITLPCIHDSRYAGTLPQCNHNAKCPGRWQVSIRSCLSPCADTIAVQRCQAARGRQDRWLSPWDKGKVGCAHAMLVQCLRPKVSKLPHLLNIAGVDLPVSQLPRSPTPHHNGALARPQAGQPPCSTPASPHADTQGPPPSATTHQHHTDTPSQHQHFVWFRDALELDHNTTITPRRLDCRSSQAGGGGDEVGLPHASALELRALASV